MQVGTVFLKNTWTSIFQTAKTSNTIESWKFLTKSQKLGKSTEIVRLPEHEKYRKNEIRNNSVLAKRSGRTAIGPCEILIMKPENWK